MRTLISTDRSLVTGAERPVAACKNAVRLTGRGRKSLYQVDQQVKFLHLQAEVESLWQQLQVLKQQRQASQEAKVLASTVTVADTTE